MNGPCLLTPYPYMRAPSPAAYEDAIDDSDSCTITSHETSPRTLKGSINAFNSVDIKDFVNSENKIEMLVCVTNYNSPYEVKCSPKYTLSGTALVQIKIIVLQEQCGHINMYNNIILVKFVKLLENQGIIYSLEVTSTDLGVKKTLIADDGTWHLLREVTNQQFSFDFGALMTTTSSYGPFASLHKDTEFTDFELRCEDGSLPVHAAVLAAHSPVFRRMLEGSWKETVERSIELPRISKFTLQHLKDYLYLEIIPDEGLEQLMMLASCYMISDLERRCKEKLLKSNATVDFGLIKFATKQRVTRSYTARMRQISV